MRTNKVYIATSLDGYIADKDGGLDWLHSIPNPEQSDFGFGEFMSGVDAIVMGRNTFETVCGFDVPWPYPVPTFVMSRTLKEIPSAYKDKVDLIDGSPQEIMDQLHSKGFDNLYIDGGITIQSFLAEDLIDELTITTIPVLLGDGIPLFSELKESLKFKLSETKVLLGSMIKSTYHRDRA